MLKLIDTEGVAAQPAPVLDRIAAALGCTVEELSDSTSNDLSYTAELLGLWTMIRDEQDRMKVLCFLRTIASK